MNKLVKEVVDSYVECLNQRQLKYVAGGNAMVSNAIVEDGKLTIVPVIGSDRYVMYLLVIENNEEAFVQDVMFGEDSIGVDPKDVDENLVRVIEREESLSVN